MDAGRVTEVATGVFWVRGRLVNWYVLREGEDVTLVDAGYPADAGELEASLRLVGRRPQDVRAVLVTHAHADHLGAVADLYAAHGTPAHAGAADLDAARTGRPDQVRLPQVLVRAWRPAVAWWAVAAVRSGGLRVAAAPAVRPYPQAAAGAAMDLPGRPVPVLTGGHTPGHTVLHLPHLGVLLTGDELVTGHPTSRRHGPQQLPAMFTVDATRATAALGTMARLDADLLLPGHGGPLRTSPRSAVAAAVAAAGQRTGDPRGAGRSAPA